MQKKTHPSKKGKFWRKKHLFYKILILLTAILIGGVFLLHTPPFRSYIFAKIDHYLQTHYNLSISANQFGFNLFRLSASLKDFKIAPITPSESLLQRFTAQKLTLNVSAITLLGRKIHLQKLLVTEPSIELTSTKGVCTSRKQSQAAKSEILSLRIDDFQLTRGKIEYQDQEYLVSAFVDNISVNIHFLEKDVMHKGSVAAQSGQIQVSESRISMNEFLAEFGFDDQSIQITRFLFKTNPFTMNASGHIQNYQQKPQYLFAIQGTLWLDSIEEFFPTGYESGGALSLTTSISGEGPDFTLEGRVRGKEIVLADIPLEKLEGDLDISGKWGALTLDSMDAKGGICFESSPTAASYPQGVIPLNGNVSFHAANGDIKVLPSSLRLNQTAVTVSGSLDPAKQFQAKYHLQSDDLGDIEPLLKPLGKDVQIKGRLFLKGEASGSLDDPKATLEVTGSDISLNEMVIRKLEGEGEVTLAGKATDPSVQFSMIFNDLEVAKENFSSIELTGRFAKQNLTVKKLDIAKGESTLEGTLGLDLATQTFDIDLEGKAIDLSSFKTINPEEGMISGLAQVRLKGNGPIENPVFTLHLSLEKLTAQSTRVGSLTLKAESNGQTVGLWMETLAGQVFVDAKLELNEPYLIHGQLRTEPIDIWHTLRSGLEPLPSPISSQVKAKADFVIPLRNWENSTVSVNFERCSFRYKDFTILNPQPITAKMETQELVIEDFNLRGPQTEFSASGRLPLKPERGGQINLGGYLNLKILEALLPGTEAAGTLNLKGSVSGPLAEPALNASIEMDDGQFASSIIPYDFRNISLKAPIRENVLHVDRFFIGIGTGSLSARGQIFLSSLFAKHLSDESLAQIQAQNKIIVSLTSLPLDNLSELLLYETDTKIGGVVDGIIRVQGGFTSPNHLEISGELKKLELSLDEFKMSNDEKIQLRMRDGVFDLDKFRLSGGNSFIQAACQLNVHPNARIDAQLSTSLDAAILSSLVEDAILGGNLSIDLKYKGPLQNPVISGNGKITNGLFQRQEPPLLATNIEGTLGFPDTETALLSLKGIINGGPADIQGKVTYRSLEITSARFEMTAERVQMNHPEGFQSLSNGTFILENRQQQWFLRGDIKIAQSYFGTDIFPGSELIRSLRTQRRALPSDIPPGIRSLNLNIGVSTTDAIVLENNLGNLELNANIRISGTLFEPRLSGYIQSRQAGQITFGNHNYEVEHASVNFQDALPLEGQLSVTGHTQLRHGYDDLKVTLTISGPLTNLEFGFSSSPPRSQIELASLLITGYGTEKLRDDTANVIGNQLMLYFMSPLASPFTERAKNLLKAEEVRIEPINIATEEDPGARFTFRKGLIHALDLIYSIDVSNTQKQTWILDYSFNKNFSVQSFAKDEGAYGASFSHRFFLEGTDEGEKALYPQHRKPSTIKSVRFEGNPMFPQKTLNRMARALKQGSVFSYRDLRKTITKLTDFYKRNNHLNVVIDPVLRNEGIDSIRIILNISPGNPATIAFTGDPISNTLKKELIAKWNGRLPAEMSVSHVKRQVLHDLNSKGYPEAVATDSKKSKNGKSIYVFSISLGPRYRIRNFAIDGQSAIAPKAIKKSVSGIPRVKGKGLWALISDFTPAKWRIKALFSEHGYQNAVIHRPQVHLDRDTKAVDITLPIQQGPQSRIHTIQITGNSAFTALDLKKAMELKESSVFSPSLLATDTNMLFSYYRSRGYHDGKIDAQTLFDSDGAAIDLLYSIQEGKPHTVSSIEIHGNSRTSERLIRKELTFKEGDILRMEDLIASQKKLYDLTVFKTVNIQREDTETPRERAKILVQVQEDPRLAVSYGLRYNSEEKLEGFGQLDLINILGRTRKGLFFFRQNKRQKDFRFSLKDPYLFGKKFNTLYSFFYTEETESVFKSDEMGLSIQQQLKMPLTSSLSYLFRINRIHTYELEPIGPFPFDIKLFLPEFQTFWVRDTRASILNAKQGSFLSMSLTYSPAFLKTDLKYLSFFGQYSLYFPLFRQLVWASNYRIGLADAFDQVLIPSRRFFAGGANSIRGFERDMVGPYNPFFQEPTGGEALFIVNQELRFPVFKWLEGVTFFDMGNVYENLGDFNPFDVRTSVGLGLRLNVPAIFLRLDYGISLTSREFEKKGVFYFSIGQAF